MGRHVVLSLFLVVSTVGCAAVSGAPGIVKAGCSYDQAWSVALSSMNEFVLTQEDKDKGVIETDWATFASQRSIGVFQRQGNKERVRFFVNVEAVRQPVRISVRQAREFFSPVGARSQGIAWKRVPPNAEEEQRLVQRITNQLLSEGCTVVG
ncbi:MAG: hypothetical protein OXF97_04525 [Nitrospira sp.]|nr:hypothetical protein [Nitrospira sp.]MCY3954586.1 hypothetical protein [Nitrospira sp.]MCY4133016.1 hypothetical protein [Nitrospira sp.]